jgi:hypothetical protein
MARHDRTQIQARAKHTIANPRDQIIDHVPQRPRDYREHACKSPPPAAQTPQNVKEGIRTHQQDTVLGQHDDAVRQARLRVCGNQRLKRGALQRCESKPASRTVVPEREPDRAVAQAAMAVVENHLGVGGGRQHTSKRIARPADVAADRRSLDPNCCWTAIGEASKLPFAGRLSRRVSPS